MFFSSCLRKTSGVREILGTFGVDVKPALVGIYVERNDGPFALLNTFLDISDTGHVGISFITLPSELISSLPYPFVPIGLSTCWTLLQFPSHLHVASPGLPVPGLLCPRPWCCLQLASPGLKYPKLWCCLHLAWLCLLLSPRPRPGVQACFSLAQH